MNSTLSLLLSLLPLTGAFLPAWAAAEKAPAAPEWKLVSDAEGIQVFRRDDPATGIMAYRGEGVLDAPFAKILTLIRDLEGRTKWADRLTKAELVRQINPLERIEYLQASPPWPVKDRDVLLHSRLELDKEKGLIRAFAKSVEDPARPETDAFVRAWVFSGDAELAPVDGGKKTRIRAEIHGDPRGSVPKWIVNLVQKSAPRKSLKKLLEIVRTQAVADDPLARELLTPGLVKAPPAL